MPLIRDMEAQAKDAAWTRIARLALSSLYKKKKGSSQVRAAATFCDASQNPSAEVFQLLKARHPEQPETLKT